MMRTVEAVWRSCNNLRERLHAGPVLYAMLSPALVVRLPQLMLLLLALCAGPLSVALASPRAGRLPRRLSMAVGRTWQLGGVCLLLIAIAGVLGSVDGRSIRNACALSLLPLLLRWWLRRSPRTMPLLVPMLTRRTVHRTALVLFAITAVVATIGQPAGGLLGGLVLVPACLACAASLFAPPLSGIHATATVAVLLILSLGLLHGAAEISMLTATAALAVVSA